jgi:hypothetical protein
MSGMTRMTVFIVQLFFYEQEQGIAQIILPMASRTLSRNTTATADKLTPLYGVETALIEADGKIVGCSNRKSTNENWPRNTIGGGHAGATVHHRNLW